VVAFKIEDNAVLVVCTGIFGWQCSPAVWAVFSRALLRAINNHTSDRVVVYVDDFSGISPEDFAVSDQTYVQELLLGVFGPGAINLTKSVLPCVICDTIVWTINIPLNCIYPNAKGRIKLMVAFFGIDTSKEIPQKSWQRMGSLASRCSRGIVGARHFVHPIHTAGSLPGGSVLSF
jgi:hypothetical protein